MYIWTIYAKEKISIQWYLLLLSRRYEVFFALIYHMEVSFIRLRIQYLDGSGHIGHMHEESTLPLVFVLRIVMAWQTR